MLLTELRTRWCLRPLRHRCEAKKGVGDRSPGSCTHLQSRILSAAEAEMLPEQQAIMLSAGRPWHWHLLDDHGAKSPTELAQNVHWRMATAFRLGATPDAGPRSTCALRKGNDGDMCEQSLAGAPVPPFLLQVRGSQKQTAVQCTLRRLIEQAGHGAPCP